MRRYLDLAACVAIAALAVPALACVAVAEAFVSLASGDTHRE